MKSTQYKTESLFARHWVLIFNTLLFIFALLPVLAPILMTHGYTSIAGVIYRVYRLTCHQLPAHSDFIGEHQVAICQRCNAMHIMLAVAGLIYALRLFRPAAISFKWLLLFMIPMGIDGGMALVSDLLSVISIYWFWGLGLAIMMALGMFLHTQKLMSWQVYLFFAAGPISLLYVQIVGPHESNWWLRSITGSLYAIGIIWFIYPMMEASFRNTQQKDGTPAIRV